MASSVRLGLRWRMLMEERRDPSNPGSGEKTSCKIKAVLGPTCRVRGSLGAREWRAGALSRVRAQGHLLTIRTRGLARMEQPLWVEIPRFTAQLLPDSSLSGFSSASQTLLSYHLENGETWAGSYLNISQGFLRSMCKNTRGLVGTGQSADKALTWGLSPPPVWPCPPPSQWGRTGLGCSQEPSSVCVRLLVCARGPVSHCCSFPEVLSCLTCCWDHT